MAPRDYVKRTNKPRNTRKSNKQPSAFPVKWAFIALTLVVAFVSGLVFLAQNKSTTDNPPPTPKAQTKKNEIPPIPQEKWSYIEALEQKEIEVEATELKRSTRPYLMQCGAYKSSEQADERKAMIAFQGLTSHTKISKGAKGDWYRVILGPYPLKREAERDRNVLRRAGIEPCEIWFWE